jgi:2-oxoacid:acceptor oxidoreductase gamma subunit (pyruvate/2-ketoisovalerate family)
LDHGKISKFSINYSNMIEIRIHGRGGQGGVTLAKILATAHHLEGRSVQAYGIYAAERSGAPLQAFVRYDEHPIHNPNQIYEPDHIVVLDPTLISPEILSGLKPGGFVLMNTDKAPGCYAGQERVAAFRIATVDASTIAAENGLGTRSVPIVNTALAGAAARITGLDLASVLSAFRDMGFHAGNESAARRAFAEVRFTEQAAGEGNPQHVPVSKARVPGILNGNTGELPAIHTGQWANHRPVWENATPPCNFVCPAGNDVQGFLAALGREDVDGALEILLQSSPFPSVCGRVCPGFCMLECNRTQLDDPVNVRALERFAGDHGKVRVEPAGQRSERIAVIGSGPAGLSGAYHLARLGYQVTIFEAGSELGGLMRTGIPVYRLPREALDRDIERILALGVRTVFRTRIDHEKLESLATEYDAVLAATGLQRLTSLDLGINIKNVIQGIEFLDLSRTNSVSVKGERVVVVGGGNTAIDAARSAFRLGAEDVRVIYRRTRKEMPAIPEEIDEAIDEGIRIDFLTSPLRISRSGGSPVLECQRMELGEPDASGRRRPVAIADSGFEIPCDRVVLALGQAADLSLLPADADLSGERADRGNGKAPLLGAGDLLTNEGTVTAAIGCGRDMALLLHERFSGKTLREEKPHGDSVVRADQLRMHHFEHLQKQQEAVLPLAARRESFAEVRGGLSGTEEAKRCLSCGVCNACDRCVTYCPDGVLRREGNQIIFDYDYCKGCGVCVTECSRAVIYMQAG